VMCASGMLLIFRLGLPLYVNSYNVAPSERFAVL
jgi:hypothetical protein